MVKFHDDILFAKAELTCIFIDAKVMHQSNSSSATHLAAPLLPSCCCLFQLITTLSRVQGRPLLLSTYRQLSKCPEVDTKTFVLVFQHFYNRTFTTLESVLQILQLVLDLTSRDSAKLHSRYPTGEPLSLCYRYPRSAAAQYGRRRCCQL